MSVFVWSESSGGQGMHAPVVTRDMPATERLDYLEVTFPGAISWRK